MINKYNENELFEDYFFNLPLNLEYFKDKTLIILTQETLRMDYTKNILSVLERNNITIEYIQKFKSLDEYKLIELYRYHKVSGKEEISPFSMIIPSLGWPLVKKRFSGPVIVCILKRDENIVGDVLKIKGNKTPENCEDYQVRKLAPSTALSLMHSADDIYSVIRETLVLLGEEKACELSNYEYISHKENQNIELLKDQGIIYKENSKTCIEAINKFLVVMLEMSYYNRYTEAYSCIKKLLYSIDEFSGDLYNEIKNSIPLESIDKLFLDVILGKYISCEDFRRLNKYVEDSFINTEIDTLLILAYLTEKYWIQQR